jgi:hypothetical protein
MAAGRLGAAVWVAGAACLGGCSNEHGSSDGGSSDANCDNGRCPVALAEVPSPTDVAVSGASVYFTSCSNDGGGSVLRVPRFGGSPATLAVGQSCPVGLAVDDANVYVAGLGGSDLAKVPLDGGVLMTLASDAGAPVGVAVNTTSVYWTSGAGLMRVSLDGGAPTLLASGQRSWTRPVLDSDFVYWGDPDLGTIQKLPLDGGSPATVGTAVETVTDLALSSTDIYFADGYTLEKAPLAGGSTVSVGLPTGAPVGAIAVDDASVYFTSWGSVWRIAFADLQPTRVATDQSEPNAIAVDGTSVYWTDGSGGHVMKLTPK